MDADIGPSLFVVIPSVPVVLQYYSDFEKMPFFESLVKGKTLTLGPYRKKMLVERSLTKSAADCVACVGLQFVVSEFRL
eukprot:174940-Amphidinium_carterae.1